MSKAGNRLIEAMHEVEAIATGRAEPGTFKVHSIDVRKIRAKTGLSQSKFALRYGFSLDTLRKWEQNTRRPNGSAMVLLKVLDHNPKAVEEALNAA